MLVVFKFLFIVLLATFFIKFIIELIFKRKNTYFGIAKPKFDKAYHLLQGALAVYILFLHGVIILGATFTITYLVYSILIGTIAELIFLKTDCLGKFHYTDRVKPKLFGILPFYVPIMWSILSYLGLWTAIVLLHDTSTNFLLSNPFVFLLSPLLITIYDLLGDPIAVEDEYWIWHEKGSYYGIPTMNYIGWLITSAIISIPLLWQIKTTHLEIQHLWILYTPAFGYYFYLLVWIKICHEKKLFMARNIGFLTIIALSIWGMLKEFSIL